MTDIIELCPPGTVPCLIVTGESRRLANLASEFATLHACLAKAEPGLESPILELLRGAFSHMPTFVAVLAPDGTFLFISRTNPGVAYSDVVGSSIYFTGYAFDAPDAEDSVLEKPVTSAALLGAIRQTLAR